MYKQRDKLLNELLNNYILDKEIDVICIKAGQGLTLGKKYKAYLTNSFNQPLHWGVSDDVEVSGFSSYRICSLDYLIPIEEWRNNQINKIQN